MAPPTTTKPTAPAASAPSSPEESDALTEDRSIRSLGLFIDGAFRRGERGEGVGRVFCGDELFGFMRFAAAVGARFDRFALIARETGDADARRTSCPGARAGAAAALPEPAAGRAGRDVAAGDDRGDVARAGRARRGLGLRASTRSGCCWPRWRRCAAAGSSC